jgi:hypothetical protein
LLPVINSTVALTAKTEARRCAGPHGRGGGRPGLRLLVRQRDAHVCDGRVKGDLEVSPTARYSCDRRGMVSHAAWRHLRHSSPSDMVSHAAWHSMWAGNCHPTWYQDGINPRDMVSPPTWCPRSLGHSGNAGSALACTCHLRPAAHDVRLATRQRATRNIFRAT